MCLHPSSRACARETNWLGCRTAGKRERDTNNGRGRITKPSGARGSRGIGRGVDVRVWSGRGLVLGGWPVVGVAVLENARRAFDSSPRGRDHTRLDIAVGHPACFEEVGEGRGGTAPGSNLETGQQDRFAAVGPGHVALQGSVFGRLQRVLRCHIMFHRGRELPDDDGGVGHEDEVGQAGAGVRKEVRWSTWEALEIPVDGPVVSVCGYVLD